MAQEFAKKFYKSKAWRSCRENYAASVGYLCERCLASGLYTPGEIVHHKIPLTPENIDDPAITLNWDRLELVCRKCHAEEHEQRQRRYNVDEAGRVRIK